MSSGTFLEVQEDFEFHVICGAGTKDLEGVIALLIHQAGEPDCRKASRSKFVYNFLPVFFFA
jgi:hypothetical protein